MDRRIKLIWDFRGPDASAIAQHHEKHLKEYMAREGMSEPSGFKDLSPVHSMAFMVVAESEMLAVRDVLRPHRGEIFPQ